MSRAEIEARLEELRSQLHKEVPFAPLSSPSVEVPRSIVSEPIWHGSMAQGPSTVTRGSALTTESDFLPRRGEEVISFGGSVHPMVEMLLRRSRRGSEEGVSQVEPSTSAVHRDEPRSGKQPSLTESSKSEMQEKFLSQPHVPRNVLWIYPRGLNPQQILECFKLAEASILRSSDQLVICWAGESNDEAAKTLSEFPVHPLEVDFIPEIHDEASVKLRDAYPLIFDFAMEAGFGKHKVKAKLEPHAGLRWMLQQELNPPASKVLPYDLVILPCLKPELGADASFEEFLLMTSPSPVILLRSPL